MNIEFKANRDIQKQQGYTLVELLVSLAVSAIVISGTLAGYTVFAKQYEVLNKRIEMDRDVLKVIGLIQYDIAMAGYKNYRSSVTFNPIQSITLTSATDLLLLFDDYDGAGTLYRSLIRYSLGPVYVSAASSGETRFKLFRDWRQCNTPETGCDLASSTSLYSAGGQGEIILDKVKTLTISTLHNKQVGTFVNEPQLVKFALNVTAAKKGQDASEFITKSYDFIARAKNVSMLP
jgi:prepilin-type N-terminal cleavage/methylation domain-containing protein